MREENKILCQEIRELREKLELVLSQLAKKEVKKDSHNSHNPPSQDKSTHEKKSLRKKTGRKSGGQKGHKGHYLAMTDNPDEKHIVKSDYCSKCGDTIDQEKQQLVSKRQIVEIPSIRPRYIEYQQYGCQCGRCGHLQKGSFPQGVKAPIQYGSSVIALVSYFSVFHYLPFQRMTQLFKDIFHLPISEGSVQNLLKKAAQKARPIYHAILQQIFSSTYVGSDETSAKVNGDKWWVWVWQNMKNTYIKATESRGFISVQQIIGDHLSHATIGSGRWAAQLKMKSKSKQLCIAHLLRDLIFLEESENQVWASQFKSLLEHALALRKKTEQTQTFQTNQKDAYKLEKRLDRLLLRHIEKTEFTKTHSFQKSMLKNRNYIFPFLYNSEVPPDNNSSERAIRNVKVKLKVSGQFKSGQNIFCVLRSCIDTLKKRELNVLAYLYCIAKLPTQKHCLVPE